MPTEELLWLDNEKRLHPGPNHPDKKHQEHPILCGTSRSFDLSVEDNQLLAKERVFRNEFRFPSGKICQRPQYERAGGWFRPAGEAMIERLKVVACQSLDGGENTMHSRRFLL